MGRHKKNKSIQIETNKKSNDEVIMKKDEQMELDLKESVDEIAQVVDETAILIDDHAAQLEALEQELDQKRIELENTKRMIEEKKQEYKFTPGRVIDEDERLLIDKQVHMSKEKIAVKAKIERQKALDNQMVTGRFMNRRAPGHLAKLAYYKYEDDTAPKWIEFRDGATYTIKKGFADQINGGTENDPCYYRPFFTQKEGAMDPDNPESQIEAVDTTVNLARGS